MASVISDDKIVEADALHLADLGYNQSLVRGYSAAALLAQSMGIMAFVPSVASVVVYGIDAGGLGITIGWLVPIFFIISLGLSLSEFASSMVCSGGFYWWTFKLAPPKLKRPLSYLSGYADTFGLIAGAGSIYYGAAEQLLAAVSMGIEAYEPTKYHTYGVYAGMNILGALFVAIPSKYMSRVQLSTLVLNVGIAVVFIIALPVGHHRNGLEFNSNSWAFGNTDNQLDWQYGWSFLLSWMAPIWSISNFDSCIHLAEETFNAPRSVPFAVIFSILICGLSCWFVSIVIAYVIDTDLTSVLSTPTGLPLAAILERSLNGRWAVGFMSIFSVMQFWMGLGCSLGASRLVYSFARDGGLPFSQIWSRTIVNGIPLNAILANTTIALLIGLLILVDSVAAGAIFNMAISSLYLSWILPVIIRAVHFDKTALTPGPFYLGHFWSRLNCSIASLYGIFVTCVLTMMPQTKSVSSMTMNYTVLVAGVVWIGSMLYYWLYGWKNFKGPPEGPILDGVECDTKSSQGSVEKIS